MLDPKQGFILNDLGRRLANIIRIGTIFRIDYKLAKARVRIGELETDWLSWVNANSANNKSWNPPQIDEQVIVLSPNGELDQALILPSLYKNNAPDSSPNIQSMTYKDGSKVSFDNDKGILDLDIKGKLTIKVAGDVQVEGKNITLKGSCNIGGTGGSPIARVGDKVKITSGSSIGEWPIISGSSKVKSL
ncbi:MAG: phage baseplate assembly protein V [Proteobacteria bacterium]|nr:phage baseplate assembly protein V [Pseudomonadota bacterium]